MPIPGKQSRLAISLVLGVGAILLCAAAWLNAAPLVFPDTVSYLVDGTLLVRKHPPLGVRPIFYGIATWPLHFELSLWPVILCQGLALAHVIYLLLRALGILSGPVQLILLFVGLTVLTPVSWYVSHALPDIFAPILVVSLFLLAACRDRLTRAELAYLLLLSTLSCCVHLSHLGLAAGLIATVMLIRACVGSARPVLQWKILFVPLVAALAGFTICSQVFWGHVQFTKNGPPFLLARLIADGPGRDYLSGACPTEHYEICKFLNELPSDSEKFIWGWYYPATGRMDYRKFQSEQGRIIAGTLMLQPGRVVAGLTKNVLNQLVTFDTQSTFDRSNLAVLEQSVPTIGREVAGGRQLETAFWPRALESLNALHLGVALLALSAIALTARRVSQPPLTRIGLLHAFVLFSLVVNAAVTGAFSGVFGRYQGRLVWLLPLAAFCTLQALATRNIRASASANAETAVRA